MHNKQILLLKKIVDFAILTDQSKIKSKQKER